MSIGSLGIVRSVRAAGGSSATGAGATSTGTGRASALGPTAAEVAALQDRYADVVGFAAFNAAVQAAAAGVILDQTNGPQNITPGGQYSRTYTCGRNTGVVRWAWYKVRGWISGGSDRRWDWIEYRTPTQSGLADAVSSRTCFGFLDGLAEEQDRATAWERDSLAKAQAYVALVSALQALYRSRLTAVSQAQAGALLGAAADRGAATAAAREAEAEREREAQRRAARVASGTALSQRLLSSTGRTAGKVRARLEAFGPELRTLWESAATAALAAGAEEGEAAAEATQAVAAEAAASGLLDALFPLAGPDYYPATWGDLTAPWQALYLGVLYPDDPAAAALPIADPDFYPADVLSLPVPWGNLFYHLAYSQETTA